MPRNGGVKWSGREKARQHRLRTSSSLCPRRINLWLQSGRRFTIEFRAGFPAAIGTALLSLVTFGVRFVLVRRVDAEGLLGGAESCQSLTR